METKETAVATTTGTKTPPNSGMVKARSAIPECKVLKRLDDTSADGVLDTITNMTGDPDFAKKFVTYVKIQVRKAWKKDEKGNWVNSFDKVPLDSVLECMYSAARRGVLPDGYNAYLVVYLGKNPRCQLLVDYKGLCDCAIADGICTDVDACEVRENDEIELSFGEVTKFNIDPKKPRGEIIGCVAYAILPNGRRKTKFIDIDELEQIRACAQSDNIWSAWTAEMYKKSAIRRLFKTMRNSPRLKAMLDVDNEDFDLERSEPSARHQPTAKVKSLSGHIPALGNAAEKVEEVAEEAVEAEPVFA